MAIRPQSICLSQSGNENSIQGTILKAIYLGGHIEYTVDCILGELFVIDNQMESKQNLDAAVSITLRTLRGDFDSRVMICSFNSFLSLSLS